MKPLSIGKELFRSAHFWTFAALIAVPLVGSLLGAPRLSSALRPKIEAAAWESAFDKASGAVIGRYAAALEVLPETAAAPFPATFAGAVIGQTPVLP